MDLTTSDVKVRVCADDNSGTYLFRCPRCAMTVVKPAEQRTVDLLVSSGVSCQRWTMPAELLETRPSGPPIGHDDLLEFHELLSDDAVLGALVASLGDA